MIRFLVYSVLFVAVSTSCGTFKYPNAVGIRESQQQQLNNYYLDTARTYAYRAAISAFDKDISGNLVIKSIAPRVHRVALLSDFGQTLFDISVFPDRHVLHYAMDDLNKKMLVKEIASIFRALTEQRLAQSALIFMDKQHYPVYVIEDRYYTWRERQVAEIMQVRGAKERFKVTFAETGRNLAKKVQVTHAKFPITMQFTLDEKQTNL